MADDLTVTSLGAGNAGVVERSREQAVDPGRQELERLQGLARERTGRTLSEQRIVALVERHKANVALTAAKTNFEGGRSRETLTSKATETQTRAATTTGARETRSVRDGLTPEQRESIRSDVNAGPTLPPTQDPPTTPEQARRLTTTFLENVLLNEQPFDLTSYSTSLRYRPAFQPRISAQTRLGTERDPLATRGLGTSLSRAGQGIGRLGTQSSGVNRSLSFSLGGTRAMGTPSGAGSASFVSGTAVSGAGLFNAGGGLITNSSFDGMRFNWDGFFANFLIRTAADMGAWRKILGELSRLEGQATLAAHDAQMALAEMRMQFEKLDKQISLNDATESAQERFRAGSAQALTGENGLQVGEHVQELEGILAEARGLAAVRPPIRPGQVLLSQAQRESLQQAGRSDLVARYDERFQLLQRDGGLTAYYGLLSQEVALAARPEGADVSEEASLAAEFTSEMRRVEGEFARAAVGVGGDASLWRAAVGQRHQLRAAREQINGQMGELGTQIAQLNQQLGLPEGPDRQRATQQLEEIERQLGAATRPANAAQLEGRRTELRAQLDGTLPANDPSRTALIAQRQSLTEQRGRLETRRTSVEWAVAGTDSLLASARPTPPGGWEGFRADFERELQEQVGSAVSGVDPGWASAYLRDPSSRVARQSELSNRLGGNQEARYRLEDTLAQASGAYDRLIAAGGAGTAPGRPSLDMRELIATPADQRQNRLNEALTAGEWLHRADSDLTTAFDSGVLKGVKSGVQVANRLLRDVAGDAGIRQGVESAVQGAIGLARQNRKEIDGMMRQSMSQAQGMLNQLIQLMGMARSG